MGKYSVVAKAIISDEHSVLANGSHNGAVKPCRHVAQPAAAQLWKADLTRQPHLGALWDQKSRSPSEGPKGRAISCRYQVLKVQP